MLSIIIPCFNNLDILKKCVEAVIDRTTLSHEILLIHNHPPFDILTYLKEVEEKHDNILVVDTGRNIGCHQAMALGFSMATGEYLVKLDDDTEVVYGWDIKMVRVLEERIDLPYLAADCTAKHNILYHEVKCGDLTLLELWPGDEGVVGFPCVMFRREFYENIPKYHNPRLYGGEEHYYAVRAHRLGYKIAKLKDVEVIHHGVGRGTPYGDWKYNYGYLGNTDKGFGKC